LAVEHVVIFVSTDSDVDVRAFVFQNIPPSSQGATPLSILWPDEVVMWFDIA
jgi:hypothetical protein